MIHALIWYGILGSLCGVGLRYALPGEQHWSIPQTFGYGLVAYLALGFLLRVLFGFFVGLIVPLLLLGGAALLISRKGGRRRGGELSQ